MEEARSNEERGLQAMTDTFEKLKDNFQAGYEETAGGDAAQGGGSK